MPAGTPPAIERCAYCRDYVPVTTVEIPASRQDRHLSALVAVCTDCFGDGR